MESDLEVIAERLLTLNSDGAKKPIRVLVGRPYSEPDGAHFCPYKIVGLVPELTKRAGGVDGIQALQLALVMIGAELSAQAGSLLWDESQFLGFPKSIHEPVLGEGED